MKESLITANYAKHLLESVKRNSENLNPRRTAVVSQICIHIGVIIICVKNVLMAL